MSGARDSRTIVRRWHGGHFEPVQRFTCNAGTLVRSFRHSLAARRAAPFPESHHANQRP